MINCILILFFILAENEKKLELGINIRNQVVP